VKKPTVWAFDYLPAAFGAAGFGAMFLAAVAGAVTVTLVFGAVAGAGVVPVFCGTRVVGCVILFS